MLNQIRLMSRVRQVQSYTALGQPTHSPETMIAAEMTESTWHQLRDIIDCWSTAQATPAGREAWQQLKLIQALTQRP